MRRPILSLSLSLVLAAALTGCVTPPTTEPLDLGVPDRFSGSGETPLPAQWWTSFEDPELDDLVEEAMGGNLSLRVAWDRLDQARAVALRAGSERWAKLDGSASRSRTETRTDVHGESVGTKRDSILLGLAASYEVDLWGRVRSSVEAADLDVRATEEDLRAAAMTLAAGVASTWYLIVEQRGQVALLDGQIETNETVLEVVTSRFRRGQVGAADVLRQRQLVEARRGERVRALEALRIFELQLAVLLGRSPAPSAEKGTAVLRDPTALPDTGLPADLLARRPDVRAAWIRVEAADQRVAVAVADRYPRLSLSVRGETGGDKAKDLFADWLVTFAANLTAPIVDGGRRRAEVTRTRAVASERLHAWGQTVLEALAEVETSLARERRTREYLASLDRQLDLSREILSRLRDSYRQGATDYLRVLEALATDQGLERTRLQARRELLLERIDLCRALGGGWMPPRPTDSVTAAEDVEKERT